MKEKTANRIVVLSIQTKNMIRNSAMYCAALPRHEGSMITVYRNQRQTGTSR